MEDWIYWWKKNFWKNNNLATYPNLITKVNISRKWKNSFPHETDGKTYSPNIFNKNKWNHPKQKYRWIQGNGHCKSHVIKLSLKREWTGIKITIYNNTQEVKDNKIRWKYCLNTFSWTFSSIQCLRKNKMHFRET